MEDSTNYNTKYVKLISSDKCEFVMDKEIARDSTKIR